MIISPMKEMAWGKNEFRFWDRLSVIGIWRYRKLSQSLNVFGISELTLTMYRMPYLLRHAKSAEFSALPRNRKGITWTGNGNALPGVPRPSFPPFDSSSVTSDRRSFVRPRQSGFSSCTVGTTWSPPTHRWLYLERNSEKPPVNHIQSTENVRRQTMCSSSSLASVCVCSVYIYSVMTWTRMAFRLTTTKCFTRDHLSKQLIPFNFRRH